MKKKWIIMAMMAIVAAVTLQSCSNDDDYDYNEYYANALVTLKTDPTSGNFYMQLDDSTTVVPINVKTSPTGNREARALVNMKFESVEPGHYAKAAYVNWIDTILTKPMAQDMGQKNDSIYGNDPVEIVRDWTTVVEDGYMNLRFRTYFGGGKAHVVNLVYVGNNTVWLHHDAMGDRGGALRDGLVAFRLTNVPDTEGKTVPLTLKWKSFSGEKSVTFKYCTRR